MSYADKLSRASALIEQHNAAIASTIAELDENNPTRKELETARIDAGSFKAKLIAAGAVSEASLAECKWEDLVAMGIPTLLARQVATIFRASPDGTPAPRISDNKASRMTFAELFSRYVPGEDNAISRKLAELARRQPVVVLTEGGIVHPDASVLLLEEVRKGLPGREIYMMGDRPHKVYRIGERPDERFDENPLYPGRPLRTDGVCDQTNRSWDGVPLRLRQIVHLAIRKTRELTVTHAEAHNILDIVTGENAETRLTQRFPKATLELDSLIGDSQAPTLKVRINSDKTSKVFGSGAVREPVTH